MNVLSALLATGRSSVLEEASRSWQQSNMDIRWVLLALGGLTIIIAAVVLYKQLSDPKRLPAPVITFNRIATQVGVSLRSRWFLVRVARQQRLGSPLTLMLSHATYCHHVRRYVATLQPGPAKRAKRLARGIGRFLYNPQWQDAWL